MGRFSAGYYVGVTLGTILGYWIALDKLDTLHMIVWLLGAILMNGAARWVTRNSK